MPHATFFSKVAAGHQSDGERTKPHRNKLKKRVPFGYSETNYVSYDLSALMGNHHSIEDVPRPTRPPRPSATDLPDLPNLPIYKTFASEFRPTTLLDEGPPPPQFPDEQQPSESATGWVLANSGSIATPIAPQIPERQVQPSRRLLGRQEVGFDIPQVPQPPPQYDRASRLAESYRSLLPDLDSLEYPESHTALLRQHSDRRPRSASNWDQWHHKYNPRSSGRFSPPPSASPSYHTLRHTTPRPGTAPGPISLASPSWRHRPAFDIPSYPPQAGNRRRANSGDAHSILTDSSTAVESDNSPIDRFSTASEILFPLQGVKGASNLCSAENCGSPSSSENEPYIPGKEKQSKSSGRITSSDYVGLQICSELLTDELLKTFFRHHPSEKRAKASKLQVLLLIEAYEAMLDNCRRELLKVPLPRTAGVGRSTHDKEKYREKERERAQRRKHIRDAVRILDHWLDSLYVIYDDAFGDEEDMEKEEGDDERAKSEADERQNSMEQDNSVSASEKNDKWGIRTRRAQGIKGFLRSDGMKSQVPVSAQLAAPSTGSSRLFRGWNSGAGF